MHFREIFLLLLFVFSIGLGRKLPKYFTKCKYPKGFTECVLKNIQRSFPQVVQNGDKEFKIRNLNPLIVKQVSIQAAATLVVDLQDAAFGDFNTLVVEDLKMDFTTGKLFLQYKLSNYTINGKYSMDGQLLMLPISGKGDLTFGCTDCTGKYDAKLTSYTKDGLDYIKVENEHNVISVTYCRYGLTNLFGGNDAVGEQLMKLLNENWEELYEEAKPALSNIMSTLVTDVANTYLSQIPFDELVDFDIS